MMRIITNTMHTADYEVILKKGIRFFLGASAVLFALYLYCVGAVTFTVLHRRTTEEAVKTSLSSISQDELSYLQKQKTLTKDYAYTQGFVDPAVVAFTSTKTAVAFNAGL